MAGIKSIMRWFAFLVGQLLRGSRRLFYRLNGVQIGEGTMISMGAKIDTQFGKVRIGSHCHITHGCVILAHDGGAKQIHRLDNSSPLVIGDVTIEDHVFIGVNSVVLCNLTIGHHSVVAAGSVVRDDVPPYSLVAGNPAKIVRRIAPSGGFMAKEELAAAPTHDAHTG